MLIAAGSFGEGAEQTHRHDDSNNAGCPSSPTVLPESTEDKEPSFQSDTRVCLQGESGLYLATGVDLVEEPTRELEREVSVTPESKCCDRDGRIPSGMGGGVRTDMLRWSMVRRGEKSSHKSFGVDGRKLWSENFHQGQGEHSCEASNGQQNSSVLYQQDGGTHSHSLSHLACQLWQWCLQHQIILSAEYLPETSNIEADRQSRQLLLSAEWMLNRAVFSLIMRVVGRCQTDLFASRLNHQLPRYISWRPDPFAIGTDALRVNWTDLKGYAFPPFALIARCLQKVRQEKCTLILVAQTWSTPAMVSSSSRIVCSSPAPVTKEAGPSVRSVQQV